MGIKYMHIAPKSKIESILEDGYLDNSDNKEWKVYGKIDDVLLDVKGFVYDLLKIQDSKYTRNAPWVIEKYIERKRNGSFLKIFPKYVDVYKVDLFEALIFETDIQKKYIIENYAYNLDNDSDIYYETAFLKKAKIINPKKISGREAAEIIGLEEPFMTYRHASDMYTTMNYEFYPKTFIAENRKYR